MILTEAKVKAIQTKELKAAIKAMNVYLEENKIPKIVYVAIAKSIAIDNFIKAVNVVMKEGKAEDLPEISIDFFNEFCATDDAVDDSDDDSDEGDDAPVEEKPAKSKKGSKSKVKKEKVKNEKAPKKEKVKKEKKEKVKKEKKVSKTGGVVSAIVAAIITDGITGNKAIYDHLQKNGIDSSPSTISHVCCVVPHVLALLNKDKK